jgi:nucleotide-binding universal stress UspA family protein
MQPYRRILVALDGSSCSDSAAEAASQIVLNGEGITLTGCHVYSARLHRSRFSDMEPGLPDAYQDEGCLASLRNTHDDLISHGMKTIADNYAGPLRKMLDGRGVNFSFRAPEGKNFAGIIDLIGTEQPDLLILGAHGQGRVPESSIGSVAERVVLHAGSTDVLLVQAPMDLKNHPIVVGIDGSPESLTALSRALEISKMFGSPVKLVAVYDPFFHNTVFRTISDNLSPESKHSFDFPSQEKLHDQIINDGLGQLYREKLQQAAEFAELQGIQVTSSLEQGKTFPEIARFAARNDAGLIVVGRFGNHREPISLVGSVPANLSRSTGTNLLIVAPGTEPLEVPKPKPPMQEPSLPWSREAELLMQNVPEFARGMARKSIEERVRKLGGSIVTPDAVRELAPHKGVRSEPGSDAGGQAAHADLVVMKKIRRFAPDFHRNIVGPKLIGRVVRKGDRVMMYEVVETAPPGPVLVLEQTRVEFR